MDWLTFFANITHYLAWPASAIIICAFLKKPIADLLARISKAKHKDTTLELTPSGQHPVESPVNNKISLTIDMLPYDSQGIMVKLEENIDNALLEKDIETDKAKFELLRNHYAALLLRSGYNQIYNLVFGSQISLLKWLNEQPEYMSRTYLETFYDNAKISYPDPYREYSFESYLNFMLHSGLIIIRDKKYYITELGRGFLTFLTENGLSTEKFY